MWDWPVSVRFVVNILLLLGAVWNLQVERIKWPQRGRMFVGKSVITSPPPAEAYV
jgi:hypothetical protein